MCVDDGFGMMMLDVRLEADVEGGTRRSQIFQIET